MDKYGEPENIKELIELEGVVGPIAERLEKNLRSFISAHCSKLSTAANDLRAREAYERLERRLFLVKPAPTWPTGGDAA